MAGMVNVDARTGRGVGLSADGYPIVMDIGVTYAWDSIDAAEAPVTLDDGTQIAIGAKYIEVGTPLVPITKQEVQTVDLSGDADPTGGTWDLTILGKTLAGIAWNVTAAALQALVRASGGPRANEVTVGKVGFVYTFTFSRDSGNVAALTVDATDLTSAGSITVTIATTTAGSADGGKYAPFDSSKNDGRQTLTREEVGLQPQTIVKHEGSVFTIPVDTEIGGLIVGGLVFRPRLKVDGTNQATMANLLAALPALRLTRKE